MKSIVLILVLAAVAVQAKHLRSQPRSILPSRPVLPDAPTYPSSRIINGEVATRGQFPHQVALTIDLAYFCGGSLISTEWVLTAAHCVVDGKIWLVTLGQQQQSVEEEGRITVITSIGIAHEKFSAITARFDIGVVKLPSPVTLTVYIGIIALPTWDDANNLFVGANATASGWGKDSDNATSVTDNLNYVELTITTNEVCKDVYGVVPVYNGTLCVSTIGGHSTCNGDSGGPLVANGTAGACVIGATSFGTETCEGGYPVAFTRITFHLDWISNHTGIEIRNE